MSGYFQFHETNFVDALHCGDVLPPWVAEPFSKWGAQVHVKKIIKNFWLECTAVTSQALKYDVMIYTPYEGLHDTIANNVTPL